VSNSDDNGIKVRNLEKEYPIIYVSNKNFIISNIINDNIKIGYPLIFDTSIREPETHNDNPITNDDKIRCIKILKEDFEYSQITLTAIYNVESN